MNTCSECIFFDQRCKRHAPVIHKTSEGFPSAGWPFVNREDWCGDFEPSPEPPIHPDTKAKAKHLAGYAGLIVFFTSILVSCYYSSIYPSTHWSQMPTQMYSLLGCVIGIGLFVWTIW